MPAHFVLDARQSNPAEGRVCLENGINGPAFGVNEDQSLIHVIDQGIFLVCPAILEMFAAERSMKWESVQRDFPSLYINLKKPNQDNQDLWEVRVEREVKITVVKGWLMPAVYFDLKVELATNDTLVLAVLTKSSLVAIILKGNGRPHGRIFRGNRHILGVQFSVIVCGYLVVSLNNCQHRPILSSIHRNKLSSECKRSN